MSAADDTPLADLPRAEIDLLVDLAKLELERRRVLRELEHRQVLRELQRRGLRPPDEEQAQASRMVTKPLQNGAKGVF